MAHKVEYGPDDYMDPHGSSLMGYVTASYDKLVELFGEPNCPYGDKTWNNWDLCFRVWDDDDSEDFDDVYVSIYDWKEMGPESSKSGEYQWHIGGFHGFDHPAHWLVTDLVQDVSLTDFYNFERRVF